MKKKKSNLIIPFIICLLIIAFGLKGFFWVISDFPKGYASSKWLTTEGIILSSSLKKSHGYRTGISYSPQITYKYTVDNFQYNSNQVAYPSRRGGKYWAESITEKYPLGSTSIVYYNPQDPSIACLEPGANYFFLTMFGLFSILFLGTGITLGCYLIKLKTKTIKS